MTLQTTLVATHQLNRVSIRKINLFAIPLATPVAARPPGLTMPSSSHTIHQATRLV